MNEICAKTEKTVKLKSSNLPELKHFELFFQCPMWITRTSTWYSSEMWKTLFVKGDTIVLIIYLFLFFLQVMITPWLKMRRTGVRLCNTAERISPTWSASITSRKIVKWLKREITQAFGLDSYTMNGNGWTKAALHSENGILLTLLMWNAQASILTVMTHYHCIHSHVKMKQKSFAPKVSNLHNQMESNVVPLFM